MRRCCRRRAPHFSFAFATPLDVKGRLSNFRFGSRAAKLCASTMSPLTPPTADIEADLDLRRSGPIADHAATRIG
jgi:hypothetical protein